MSEETKAYDLDFSEEAEPPKAERKGIQPKAEYGGTISAFIESKKDFAKIKLPSTVKVPSARAGLNGAIVRMGLEENFKVIVRNKELYICSRIYFDKKKWIWKTQRKPKEK